METLDIAELPESEQKILRLVATRLICATGEKHIYDETTLTVSCEGSLFTAKGKTVVQDGWKGMIDGYPQRNDAECITLSEACMEDHVAVEIRSTETGMCFEEHVTCDEDGNLNHAERDLSRCKCRNCGEISYFGSFENLDDAECSECGECGFDRCEEE